MASRLPSWLKGRIGARASPFVLNVILIATWGRFRVRWGAIVGAVVDVPTAIAGFCLHIALYSCLLFFAATVARQYRSCRFWCGVRRHMQALGVDEYRRAGKRARRRCRGACVRCSRRRKGRLRCPLMSFLVLWLSSWAAIAFFRIAPAFALRGGTLSPRVTEALGYIPPAAFAALVANDLISPGAFDAGLWQGLIPWIAAAGVVAVAIKTKSMLWCCVSGIVLYIVLSLV